MNEHPSPQNIAHISREVRRNVIEMAYRTKTAHIGPALSITDLLTVLYFKILRIDPQRPDWSGRDRFILSKGHAASALYATLAHRGYFPVEELSKYCVDGGRFHGHPSFGAAPGIEFSSGSLGHGLSVGAGIAQGLGPESPSKVYVLLGDGECNEGSVWEAAMYATTHKLRNLVALVDRNGFQGFGASSEVHPMNMRAKWEAFGWNARETDGHNLAAIEHELLLAADSDRPTVIIADTVAGKGMKAIEGTLLSHYFVPNQPAFEQAMKDLYAE